MQRRVEPEQLDDLTPNDPRAVASRGDLRWLNRVMGHPRRIAVEMERLARSRSIRRVADLGAGDGSLWPSIARRVSDSAPAPRLELVDRRVSVEEGTLDSLRRLGWDPVVVEANALDWLNAATDSDAPDLIVTNLFLHHFEAAPLRELLARIAARAPALVACEPRRNRLAEWAVRTLRWVGCHPVTQHDARISVRAGFQDGELSVCWPANEGWRLTERRFGAVSHLFVTENLAQGSH